MGMKSFGLKHALLMGAAAFGLGMGTAMVTPAYAQEATRSYDIPAQDLDDALREFGRQTGRDVLFTPDAVAGKRSGPLIGQMTERQALESLLAGSGLRFEQTASGGYAVQDPNSPTRLGEAGDAAPSEEEVGTAEILVVGRRTLNADIRRTEDDTQPYVVFDREQIERSQAPDLESFFRSQLPMNTAAQTLGQFANEPFAVNSQVNLRGLGTNQTLILVDGRRVPGVSLGGDIAQPDISGMPLSSIERIEVLPATAGAIYGGSATGGVINIIRKRDYSGLDLGIHYGDTFDNAVTAAEINVTGGAAFNDGRTHFTFSGSRSDGSALLASERDFGRQSRELLLRNNPAAILNDTAPPTGWLPNICSATQSFGFTSCDSTPLVFDDGTALGSSITFVPSQYAGPAVDDGAALAAQAGSYDLRAPNNGLYLLRAPEVESLSAGLRHEFLGWMEGYVDASTLHTVNDLSSGALTRIVFLPESAPNNPFQQDIAVKVTVPELHLWGRNEVEVQQITAGLIFRLPASWSANLEHNAMRTDTMVEFAQDRPLTPDGEALLAASALQDLNAHPIDLTPYLLPAPVNIQGPFGSNLQSTSIRLSGPALDLPAGNLQLTALAEHREETLETGFVEDPQAVLFGGQLITQYPERTLTADSLYLEANLPIIAPHQDIPLVHELGLQAAVRRDEYELRSTRSLASADTRDGPFPEPVYSTVEFGSTNYLLGLRYAPSEGIAFRTSFATGYLPPALTQILPITQTANSPSSNPLINPPDPRRGGTRLSTPRTQVRFGNPDLQPEESESWSTGLIFTPTLVENLRVSIDYTSIRKTGEIFLPNLQFIIDNEDSFPGRVIRGPNLPTDPVGWAGPVTHIDASFLNISESAVDAYDVQLDYAWPTDMAGRFSLSAVATWMRRFERQLTASGQPFDSVGYSDGPLEFRGNLTLSWEYGPWMLSWMTQHYDSYSVTYASPTVASQNDDRILNQGSSRIPSQIYHDAFIRFDFSDTSNPLLQGTVLSLGIQNLFNDEPPVLVGGPETFGAEAYSPYGDPRLRRFTVSLRRSF